MGFSLIKGLSPCIGTSRGRQWREDTERGQGGWPNRMLFIMGGVIRKIRIN